MRPRGQAGDAFTIPRHPRFLPVKEANMENMQGPFNNQRDSKETLYSDDIIQFSHLRHIHRLQFTLRDNRHSSAVMAQLMSLFEYLERIKDGEKTIYRFRHGPSRVEFCRWGRNGFNEYAVIVYEPDFEIQNLMLRIIQMYPMTLSQVEVAFDFIADNPCDQYYLRKVMTDGIVLKYSRAGCYLNYSGTDFRTTEYIGKNHNVRKGSKGLRIYDKQQDGRRFLRMELQFNRPFIRDKGISLPVHADSFNLFDFIDYREELDEDRLLRVLLKKWRKPIERVADVKMLRSLEVSMVYSWILSVIIYPSTSVSDQISRFKENLKPDNLSHRVNEFFPKSPKKEMLLEDVPNGFVRRECLRTMKSPANIVPIPATGS
jgi:hypothetical protein